MYELDCITQATSKMFLALVAFLVKTTFSGVGGTGKHQKMQLLLKMNFNKSCSQFPDKQSTFNVGEPLDTGLVRKESKFQQ